MKNKRKVKTNKSRGNRIKTTKSLPKMTAASSFWMFNRRTKSSSLLASKSSGRKGPKGTTCRIIKRVIVHFFAELYFSRQIIVVFIYLRVDSAEVAQGGPEAILLGSDTFKFLPDVYTVKYFIFPAKLLSSLYTCVRTVPRLRKEDQKPSCWGPTSSNFCRMCTH